VNYYKRAGIDFTAVGWDRAGEGKDVEHYEFCHYKAGTNKGGFQAMKDHSKWMWFVFRYLIKHRDVTTIHACDLNVAFPAAMFKMFFKRDVVLIFDVCDWFSDNFARYKTLCKILRQMEKFACKQADHIIICEPERRAQITFPLDKEPVILPNIPEISDDWRFEKSKKYAFDNDWLTIGYFGGFSMNRFLPELLELTKTERFNLLIAGYGNKSIEEKCKEVNDRVNVKYFGRLSMKDGLEMEANADIISTIYCKVNPNHVYAAPNKFYEALYLGKALLTNKGIIVESKVNNNKIGFAIDETPQAFKAWIGQLKKEDVECCGQNAQQLWETTYKDYIAHFFDDTYSKFLK
jgi:hypothetical protein